MPASRDPFGSFTTVFPKQLPSAAARVMHVYYQLRNFERASSEHQERLLGRQLRHLLQHARKYSPFWKARLSDLTLDQASVAETLTRIQPLTRKELQIHGESLSADFPQREALGVVTGSSSGSTGTPVRFERCKLLYWTIYQAIVLQSAHWHGIDQAKPLGVIGTRCKDKERAPLGIPFKWLGPVAVGFERCSRDRDIPELYQYCAERDPTYLQCGPTIAARLARYALENGLNRLRPDAILTLGSLVTDEIRELTREGLGARIVDRYSCEETGYIAVQCPKHNHFHVVSPATYVEIVDEDNKPCPLGKPGRVLITSMQSYAMPLIRYELGDFAEWGEPCDCGITLPVIKRLWGRTRHLITNPDGRQVYARIYAREFETIQGLLEYRFVLHKDSIVVAQLKVANPSPQIAEAVTAKVRDALGYAYPVAVKFVEEIDWGTSWKQEYFAVSDAPAPT